MKFLSYIWQFITLTNINFNFSNEEIKNIIHQNKEIHEKISKAIKMAKDKYHYIDDNECLSTSED